MQQNEKRMKAAIAISRATIGDVCKKDETISKLEKDLNEVKFQFIKEVNNLLVFSRFIGNYDSAKNSLKVFVEPFFI